LCFLRRTCKLQRGGGRLVRETSVAAVFLHPGRARAGSGFFAIETGRASSAYGASARNHGEIALEARNLAPEIAHFQGQSARTSSSGGAENLGKFESGGAEERQLPDFDPVGAVPRTSVAVRLGGRTPVHLKTARSCVSSCLSVVSQCSLHKSSKLLRVAGPPYPPPTNLHECQRKGLTKLHFVRC